MAQAAFPNTATTTRSIESSLYSAAELLLRNSAADSPWDLAPANNWLCWQVTDLATFRGNLPSPRCAHALAAPQGGRLLYLFGGIVRPPSSPASLAVDNGLYVYDPVLGTVTAAGPGAAIPTNSPPAPRAVFGFAAIGSLLYVFGGADQYNANGACVGRRNATQDEGRKHATHRAGSAP